MDDEEIRKKREKVVLTIARLIQYVEKLQGRVIDETAVREFSSAARKWEESKFLKFGTNQEYNQHFQRKMAEYKERIEALKPNQGLPHLAPGQTTQNQPSATKVPVQPQLTQNILTQTNMTTTKQAVQNPSNMHPQIFPRQPLQNQPQHISGFSAPKTNFVPSQPKSQQNLQSRINQVNPAQQMLPGPVQNQAAASHLQNIQQNRSVSSNLREIQPRQNNFNMEILEDPFKAKYVSAKMQMKEKNTMNRLVFLKQYIGERINGGTESDREKYKTPMNFLLGAEKLLNDSSPPREGYEAGLMNLQKVYNSVKSLYEKIIEKQQQVQQNVALISPQVQMSQSIPSQQLLQPQTQNFLGSPLPQNNFLNPEPLPGLSSQVQTLNITQNTSAKSTINNPVNNPRKVSITKNTPALARQIMRENSNGSIGMKRSLSPTPGNNSEIVKKQRTLEPVFQSTTQPRRYGGKNFSVLKAKEEVEEEEEVVGSAATTPNENKAEIEVENDLFSELFESVSKKESKLLDYIQERRKIPKNERTKLFWQTSEKGPESGFAKFESLF